MSEELLLEHLIEKINIILNKTTLSIEDRDELTSQAIIQFHSLPAIAKRLDRINRGEIKESLDTEFIEKIAMALGYRRVRKNVRPRFKQFMKYLEKEVR